MERQTESRNPRARGLGKMSTRQILELLNDEDATVAAAVRAAIPQIERAVDLIVPALTSGHRLFYVGAGTSGRLGVLDASEMPPTFGVEPELVTGIIAGWDHALRMSIEGAEDAPLGLRDLAARATAGDVVVGISASGRAPYVVDAIEGAKRDLHAAATIAITCTPDSALARAADVAIVVEVGPEVIAGSSRSRIEELSPARWAARNDSISCSRVSTMARCAVRSEPSLVPLEDMKTAVRPRSFCISCTRLPSRMDNCTTTPRRSVCRASPRRLTASPPTSQANPTSGIISNSTSFTRRLAFLSRRVTGSSLRAADINVPQHIGLSGFKPVKSDFSGSGPCPVRLPA